MIRSPLMTVMVDAVMKAAKGLRRDFGEIENLQVSRKGPGDFVSAADLKAEKILREQLERARPDYGFVLEEGGVVEGKDPAHRWHIDPLDGTLNFLHGIPHWCISVGLEREGVLVAGVVYDPAKDELFIAERGKGAFVNNRRMRVSSRVDAIDFLVGSGIPTVGQKDHAGFLRQLGAAMLTFANVRRQGAAALDLCYVAAGRLDGYWETGVKTWDVAAGALMVREAGGYVSDGFGKDTVLGAATVVAGNEAAHASLLKLLKDTRSA